MVGRDGTKDALKEQEHRLFNLYAKERLIIHPNQQLSSRGPCAVSKFWRLLASARGSLLVAIYSRVRVGA